MYFSKPIACSCRKKRKKRRDQNGDRRHDCTDMYVQCVEEIITSVEAAGLVALYRSGYRYRYKYIYVIIQVSAR